MHRALAAVGVLVLMGGAQAQSPLSIRVQQNQAVQRLSDGGTLSMAANAIGEPATAEFTLTNITGARLTVSSVELTGSTDFRFSQRPATPLVLAAQASFSFSLDFRPTTSNRVAGQITVVAQSERTSSLAVNVAGTAPEFSFSYTLQPGGNETRLAPGGSISFPDTNVEGASAAVVGILNRGSSPGFVESIAVSGARFQASGLPLLGASFPAGRELRFTIKFAPKELGASRGDLEIRCAGQQFTFALAGTGAGPLFEYEAAANPLRPNQWIALPDAPVGERSSVEIRIRNAGNAEGRIAAIESSGEGYRLGGLPFFPLVLAPGAAANFTVVFTPSQPGRASGRLRIGADTFELTSTGLGASLVFTYASATTSATVRNNGSVIFTPAEVGRSAEVIFSIANAGTAATNLKSIGIAGSSTAFRLSDLPELPRRLEPGEGVGFRASFAPAAVGLASASLRIDDQTINLSGLGTAPEPLPAYNFEIQGEYQEPLQQPAFGLTLAAAYPYTIQGTMTLKFSSDVFGNDPAVQFASGGRVVNFTVPANTTQAVFPNNATQMRIQTGTVAGNLSLTPSFTTEGGFNLTPASPYVLNWTVKESAPRLLAVQIGSRSPAGFTLAVSGFATSRALTSIEFRFTPAPGVTLPTDSQTLNVEPAFLSWYQSSQSQQFGSLFTASVPFTLQGEPGSASLVDRLQSVSVKVANRLGSSGAISLDLH